MRRVSYAERYTGTISGPTEHSELHSDNVFIHDIRFLAYLQIKCSSGADDANTECWVIPWHVVGGRFPMCMRGPGPMVVLIVSCPFSLSLSSNLGPPLSLRGVLGCSSSVSGVGTSVRRRRKVVVLVVARSCSSLVLPRRAGPCWPVAVVVESCLHPRSTLEQWFAGLGTVLGCSSSLGSPNPCFRHRRA